MVLGRLIFSALVEHFDSVAYTSVNISIYFQRVLCAHFNIKEGTTPNGCGRQGGDGVAGGRREELLVAYCTLFKWCGQKEDGRSSKTYWMYILYREILYIYLNWSGWVVC